MILFKQILTLFKTHSILLIQLVCAFLLPIKILIFLVGFMIVLDTITGIWKARKRKEKITSHKLSQIISKMVLYNVGVISVFVLDKFLLGEFVLIFTSIEFFITKLVAIFFCTIELLSINENIKIIYGLNFWEIFKKLVKRVKEAKDGISDITKSD
jgi:Bacteriophage holin family